MPLVPSHDGFEHLKHSLLALKKELLISFFCIGQSKISSFRKDRPCGYLYDLKIIMIDRMRRRSRKLTDIVKQDMIGLGNLLELREKGLREARPTTRTRCSSVSVRLRSAGNAIGAT